MKTANVKTTLAATLTAITLTLTTGVVIAKAGDPEDKRLPYDPTGMVTKCKNGYDENGPWASTCRTMIEDWEAGIASAKESCKEIYAAGGEGIYCNQLLTPEQKQQAIANRPFCVNRCRGFYEKYGSTTQHCERLLSEEEIAAAQLVFRQKRPGYVKECFAQTAQTGEFTDYCDSLLSREEQKRAMRNWQSTHQNG